MEAPTIKSCDSICLPPRLWSSWAMWWMQLAGGNFLMEIVLEFQNRSQECWFGTGLPDYQHGYPLNKMHVYRILNSHNHHNTFGFHSSCLLEELRRFCFAFISHLWFYLLCFHQGFTKKHFTGFCSRTWKSHLTGCGHQGVPGILPPQVFLQSTTNIGTIPSNLPSRAVLFSFKWNE